MGTHEENIVVITSASKALTEAARVYETLRLQGIVEGINIFLPAWDAVRNAVGSMDEWRMNGVSIRSD